MNLYLVAPSICVLVSGAFTTSAIRDFWLGLRSRRWPTTHGRVLSSMPFVHSGARWISNVADVEYEYVVDNERYTSNRYAYDGFGIGRADSRAVANRHDAGDGIRIHYDPRRPRHSCVRPGAGAANALQVIAGLVTLLPALIWWWSVARPVSTW